MFPKELVFKPNRMMVIGLCENADAILLRLNNAVWRKPNSHFYKFHDQRHDPLSCVIQNISVKQHTKLKNIAILYYSKASLSNGDLKAKSFT